MALVYNFEVSENELGTILYLDDNTGIYEATENPGGYGAPNTARADLALIVLAKYKASSGDVTITASTYDPETVTQWTFPASTLQGDGYYKFDVYPVAKKAAQSPTLNTFVYDFTNNRLERGTGSAWVTAVYTELETYSAAKETVHHAHIPDLFSAFNLINKLIIEGNDTGRTDLKQYLLETRVMIAGSLSYFTEGNYTLFQTNIEKYQSRVDTILELE